jgi:hypothetical protein
LLLPSLRAARLARFREHILILPQQVLDSLAEIRGLRDPRDLGKRFELFRQLRLWYSLPFTSVVGGHVLIVDLDEQQRVIEKGEMSSP